ncbi:DivIVA domain-containing protein [Anaerorhabdus furcosa]|uniref:Cell division initiation protein n=1 Tax=Anaerorhabdus furcosa TaxID=118967 RepID=A0A1T4PSV4_9FIRM|nr:DivIVA domain-containing protein [Anaerorhabdus furcosa]SJZ94724.1 cell division initiation protein [Anaerorhabdus furcosa]
MAKIKPEFRMMKNGYDRFAVDDAIEEYATEIETLESKLALYEKEIQDLSEQLNSVRNRYQVIVSELSIKEKAADDIARLALKEANIIIDSAQSNADSIVREALSTARIILSDLSRISIDASVMKDEMHEQLTQLIQAIDDFEIPKLPEVEWIKDFEFKK